MSTSAPCPRARAAAALLLAFEAGLGCGSGEPSSPGDAGAGGEILAEPAVGAEGGFERAERRFDQRMAVDDFELDAREGRAPAPRRPFAQAIERAGADASARIDAQAHTRLDQSQYFEARGKATPGPARLDERNGGIRRGWGTKLNIA